MDPQGEPSVLSKNSLKRIKRDEAWQRKKEELKVRRKEQKQKQRQKRAAEIEKAIEAGDLPPDTVISTRMHNKPPQDQISSGVTVVLDCGFEDKMNDREIKSLGQQLTRCYSANKCSQISLDLQAYSFLGRLQTRMNEAVAGYVNWGEYLRFNSESIEEKFVKNSDNNSSNMKRVVYLTADSPNILNEFTPDCVYIIGALVDKNRHKNICFTKAKELGLETAQLPIKEHVKLSHGSVLAVNHVVEIILRYLQCKNWPEAFSSVIPTRKIETSLSQSIEK